MAVENNMDDELDQVSAEAMQIIMSAGDARVSCNDALKAIAEGNVESARELIKKRKGRLQRHIMCRQMPFRARSVERHRRTVCCLPMRRTR